jgi:flagellar biosynthesis protein FliP
MTSFRFAKYRLAKLFVFVLMFIAGMALPAAAQQFSLNLGDGDSSVFTGRIFQIVVLITMLSLAPSLLVVVTSFTRIVIVLSLMRSAIGVQQTPPNTVIIGLSLFLTAFIMEPTFLRAYNEGVAPLINEEITEQEALVRTAEPFHQFMRETVREKDLVLFLDLAGFQPPEEVSDLPWRALIPAFMVSELKRAFEIGFLVFVPFIVIDMVIASVLMSMGMMMLPPIMISLPFKLIFFVLVDGWHLIARSLVQSFGT